MFTLIILTKLTLVKILIHHTHTQHTYARIQTVGNGKKRKKQKHIAVVANVMKQCTKRLSTEKLQLPYLFHFHSNFANLLFFVHTYFSI